MASIEALSSLKRSVESWDEYVVQHSGPVDLANADLSGCDLSDRYFDDCDLTASDLSNTNLDGVQFRETNLTATVLKNASLVGCLFTHSSLASADLSYTVLRGVRFDETNITDAVARNCYLGECVIQGGSLSGLQLNDARIIDTIVVDTTIANIQGERCNVRNCRFTNCKVDALTLYRSDVEKCEFAMSSMVDCHVHGPRFAQNSFVSCRLVRIAISSDDTRDLDLTQSVLRDVDLTCLGLPTATLLDAAVTGCPWPPQRGKVTITGRYRPSPWLLGQPVQDLKGLTPLIRREIADAQYLVSRLAHDRGIWRQSLMRLWGATSSYGQSLGRLLAFSGCVIVFNSGALLLAASCPQAIGRNPEVVVDVLVTVGRAFVGLDLGVNPYHGWAASTIIAASRLAGLAALGVWISIAAQRLGRLSSE